VGFVVVGFLGRASSFSFVWPSMSFLRLRILFLCDAPRVPRTCLLGSSLTLAVSGRRPDEAFQVRQYPQTGGGHVHGVVRSLCLLCACVPHRAVRLPRLN
jgi:hypothetical protein